MHSQPSLNIAVSSCLLGQAVRYDGRDKANAYLLGDLARFCNYHPICPEMAIGLGVPRAPIQLMQGTDRVHLVAIHDQTLDYTREMTALAQNISRQGHQWHGYIFKQKSPSCSLTPVAVQGAPRTHQPGLFAGQICRHQPLLPVIEAEALIDIEVRDNFLERVFAYRHWQQLSPRIRSTRQLMAFHQQQHLGLLAHGAAGLKRMEETLAQLDERPLKKLKAEYLGLMMAQLARPATRPGHGRVLRTLLGQLKASLKQEDYRQLKQCIKDFQNGEIPLVQALSLLKHHSQRRAPDLIAQHAYLNPPQEAWFLRFHQ